MQDDTDHEDDPRPGSDENDEIRKRLAKRRAARRGTGSREAGSVLPPKPKSLGEALLETGKQSAEEWINRTRGIHSRAQEEEKRAAMEAERRKAAELKRSYDADDVAGLRVTHDLKHVDLEEGEEIILTLKDASVLDGEDGEDELESLEIGQRERQKEIDELRSGKPRYDVFGEDAEDETVLLAKYEDKKSKKRESGMRLGELYSAADADAHRDAEGRKAFSLETESRIQTEFKPAKPVKFRQKKRRKRSRKEDRPRSRRSVLAEILPEPEDPVARQEDHSSREVSIAAIRQRQEEERRKALADQSYLVALRQAERQRLGGRVIRTAEEEEEDGAADAALRASLERARLANLAREREKRASELDPAERLRAQMARMAKKRESREGEDGERNSETVADSVVVKTERGNQTSAGQDPSDSSSSSSSVLIKTEGEGIVFTETTEFIEGLESRVEELRQMRQRRRRLRQQAKQELTQVKTEPGSGGDGGEGGTKQEQESKKRRGGDWRKVAEASDEDGTSDEDEGIKMELEEESGEEEPGEDLFTAEPLIDEGLGAALELVRQRGLLQEEQSQFGRSRDKPLVLEDDPAPHLKIGVYDDEGRLLKPKEAFRYISHAFHGRKPGVKKREKRLKMVQQELEMQGNLATKEFAGFRRVRSSSEDGAGSTSSSSSKRRRR